jgi:tetraacyldisaccharide 4'-kinase
VFLLDDAFQHRRAEREVDLVLLDATEPFGFGRLLPRGLLREPLSALARADGVILTRVEALDERSLAALDERVAHYHGRPAIAHAVYEWAGLLDDEDREHPLDALAGARVVAACGVGRPESFERALRNHRVDLAHILTLPDHHAYRLADARNLVALARRESASAVILTGKDWTKLAKPWADVVAAEEAANRPTPRVLRPELRVSFPHGEAAVQALLEGLPRLAHGSSD